ncbi:hypothetical protein N7448_009182 [Penicillium atrosanguineum]|uniref:Uncharacterized protein n=1 Tax=Penicillium atrosanguineum TaxID=1132637 RepID=A0A9W9KVX9_9EURO|nr:uncharacterized protein N7443_006429 [Penicillium atrosanguineum]KAJ5123085.1 hypothetical protein N7448_009182 [Penicillium atrosanguineum]KAJ5298309.1 hypothetical protein N7443_006429 [Penicillium atrosanguineum]KAJ5321424.1 hypothetical protein N7476_004426 [Penicillium atrosanguineum]
MDESPAEAPFAAPNISQTPNREVPRGGISEIQKKALRDWVRNQETRPRHAACIAWFERTYQKRITQSTVSNILSKKYDHLDSGPVSSALRKQIPQWPLLEKELSDWLLQQEQAGRTVNGEEIMAKARELWPQVHEEEQVMPQFSQGWLTRFRKRYAVRVSDGIGIELPTTLAASRKEINGLRTFCGEFMPEDLYSMGETGLLWRKAPFDTIPNEGQLSLYKERSRVCLMVCTNCTGGDRLPLWVIGHKEKPEPLRTLNLKAIGAQWRHSRNAWVTTATMSDWLLSFYEHVGDRRVLLLLDECHAHQAAVETTPPPANVHIQFFPRRANGITAPLTMGITQSLKDNYRKRYLSYLAEGLFQAGQSPVRTMSLYYTLDWITRIWRWDVPSATVFKAFRRSTLIEPQLHKLTAPKIHGIHELYNTVIQYNQTGQPATSLEQYLNPVGEETDEQPNDTPWSWSDTETAELDEAFTIIPTSELLPSAQSVFNSIQEVFLYMQHHQIDKPELIQSLETIERLAMRDLLNSQN